MKKEFEKFKILIIQKKYFEAHEILEEIWQPMRKSLHPDRDILRGFINAAVSLELKKQKRDSYLKVWKTYEKHKKQIINNKLYLDLTIFLDNYK